jgi:glucose-1-phosphate adenylyltransferase
MGVYVFSKRALLEALRECAFVGAADFGKHVLPSFAGSNRAVIYKLNEQSDDLSTYWRDVGTMDSYYETSMDLLPSTARLNPYDTHSWPTRSFSGSASLQPQPAGSFSRVASDAKVALSTTLHSIVSGGAQIETGADVAHSVILPGAQIGRGARIRRAIISRDAVVPPLEEIGYDIEKDRDRYLVTPGGVVVVTAGVAHVQTRSRQAQAIA